MRIFKIPTIVLFLFIGLAACSDQSESTAVTSAPATEAEQIVTEQQPAVDWILNNGQILTVDQDFSVAEAIAITDGRIVATGSNEDILAYAGSETKRTDLAGQTVVPGLIDNHMHFVRATMQWYREVRWDGITSREQALEMLKERASILPEGEWVVVNGGWLPAQFRDNSALFTVAELDAVLPDTPLYIQEAYARGFVNSAALNAAGVSADSVVNGRGSLVKDDAGNLTGELVGGAMSLVTATIPAVTQDAWDASLQATTQSMHKMGLTSVYDLGGNTVTPAFYDSVSRIAANNNLSMRVFYSLNGQNSNSATPDDIIAEMESHSPDLEGLRFAQFGYGEQVYQPMRAGPARPGAAPWQISEEDLEHYKAIATAAVDNGWQIHEHSHVEEKIRAMLSTFEEINRAKPITDLRWTIAHANGISAETAARARDLGIVFALHGTRRNVIPEDLEREGEAGMRVPPIKTIHEQGSIWGLGSDSTTVSSPNPFHTLGWAVSGRSAHGAVTFTETVSREAALTAHTRSNAYIMFRENDLGSLEPGKLADFVVLDRDYLTVPEEEIENLYSVMTVVDGEVVYAAP